MLSPAFEEWVIRPSDLQARQALADGLRLHPITAAVLVARGVRSCDDAAAILLDEGAVRPDPFLLPGMEPAIDRIHRAAVTGERVLVYGDYDVDGTSATALYVQFVNVLGLEINSWTGTEGVQLRLKDLRSSHYGEVAIC
jgi:single-stranded-DNA-specific exonuclease